MKGLTRPKCLVSVVTAKTSKRLAEELPKKIRVSVGSAIELGLTRGMLKARPSTIYLLTYREGRCSANCGFCPQAKTSTSRGDMLSRVDWPPFPTEKVLHKIGRAVKLYGVKRVCIQALNYPGVFNDLLCLTKGVTSRINVPISVSCQPLKKDQMKKLAGAGVERIGIALDAATEGLFNKIKGRLAGGPYFWKMQLETLKQAVQVFGKGFVSTHLIVGLGENGKEMIRRIQWCVDSSVYPSLFAFTPIPGTMLEKRTQPPLNHYRTIQLAHYLIVQGKTRYENMRFSEDGDLIDFGVSKKQLFQITRTGKPFLTSGCPGCNRPFYNERPGGPTYNYPNLHLIRKETHKILEDLEELLGNAD